MDINSLVSSSYLYYNIVSITDKATDVFLMCPGLHTQGSQILGAPQSMIRNFQSLSEAPWTGITKSEILMCTYRDWKYLWAPQTRMRNSNPCMSQCSTDKDQKFLMCTHSSEISGGLTDNCKDQKILICVQGSTDRDQKFLICVWGSMYWN